MSEERKFECIDQDGNSWKVEMRQNEKYQTRYELHFVFNGKDFVLQHFGKMRDAKNFWDLMEMLPKGKGE